MLTAVKNNLRFIMLSLKYNLKACMQYKKSFIVQTIFMFMNNGFFLIFWNVVFGVNNGKINSLEINDILYIWAISTASWGISNFIFGGIGELNQYILNGTLDTYLLQPKNMILNIAMSKNDFGACGDLLYGMVLAIYVSNSIFSFMKLLFYIILGSIITTSCLLIIRLLGFVIGDVEKIVHIYENNLFITLSIYPFEIFGGFIKAIMFTIVPVAYVVYFPTLLIKKFDLKIFAILIFVTIFFTTLAIVLFYKALKKYESGNNIAMKE
mgnify:CR=1 FL=1